MRRPITAVLAMLACGVCAAQVFVPPIEHQFEYDAENNLTRRVDGLGNLEQFSYDALDQPVQHIDAAAGVTRLEYDGRGQTRSVVTPNGATTEFLVDGLGRDWAELSPDRGGITVLHDEAGLPVERTNALGEVVRSSYDALGRVLRREYFTPGAVVPDRTHQYFWDSALHGIGQLGSVATDTTRIDFGYDAEGRPIQQTLLLGGLTFELAWSYEAGTGRLATQRYPSGSALGYAYDTTGKVLTVLWDGQPVADQIGYEPFGPVSRMVLANGVTHQRGYYSTGRLASYTVLGKTMSLRYDAAGRVTAIVDFWNPDMETAEMHGYDSLGRVTHYGSSGKSFNYQYDPNGNRSWLDVYVNGLSQTISYAYEPGSNRQSLINLSVQQRDANGALLDDGFRQFVYDSTERLSQMTVAGTITRYDYDALGERVSKQVGSGAPIYYVHDPAGRLIGEYDELGRPLAEYAWLDALPVAVRQFDYTGSTPAVALYAIESDHLGTPRALSDSQGRLRWRWKSAPFGETTPNQDPLGIGPVSFNLRYPGQYFDQESGLYYNYFRTYDPGTGRYLKSDPIGLHGGINTYGYVGGNPISYIDPLGLMQLPNDPSGLPSDWQRDPSHRDPNGERYRHPSGDSVDFHRGRPGAPGWRGKDHWHHNGGEEHLKPGDEVPDPQPAPPADDSQSNQKNMCGQGCRQVWKAIRDAAGAIILFTLAWVCT